MCLTIVFLQEFFRTYDGRDYESCHQTLVSKAMNHISNIICLMLLTYVEEFVCVSLSQVHPPDDVWTS